MLIEEFFKYWLSIDSKDYVKKLLNHPALLKEDFETINSIIEKNK